ncbi:MAG TPA: hypothetical protein VGB86_07690 [Methylomirabilota bacterium]|jgi:hypothetical protein
MADIALTSLGATAHDRADRDSDGRTHNVTAHPQPASGAIMAIQATGEIRAHVHRNEPGR